MERAIDIHNYDKQLVSTLERMKSSSISNKNKAIIEKFGNSCFATGIGKPRVIKYVQTLKTLALWLKKDLEKANREDIKKVVTSIQQRSDYSEWTKKDFKVPFEQDLNYLKDLYGFITSRKTQDDMTIKGLSYVYWEYKNQLEERFKIKQLKLQN